MPKAQTILTEALAGALLALTALALMTMFSGCGVISDMARDNEFHLGSRGRKSFISPAKLRVGILNFRDEGGLGTPEAGPNMARLMTERFADNSHLVMVPPSQLSETAIALGWMPLNLGLIVAITLGVTAGMLRQRRITGPGHGSNSPKDAKGDTGGAL